MSRLIPFLVGAKAPLGPRWLLQYQPVPGHIERINQGTWPAYIIRNLPDILEFPISATAPVPEGMDYVLSNRPAVYISSTSPASSWATSLSSTFDTTAGSYVHQRLEMTYMYRYTWAEEHAEAWVRLAALSNLAGEQVWELIAMHGKDEVTFRLEVYTTEDTNVSIEIPVRYTPGEMRLENVMMEVREFDCELTIGSETYQLDYSLDGSRRMKEMTSLRVVFMATDELNGSPGIVGPVGTSFIQLSGLRS